MILCCGFKWWRYEVDELDSLGVIVSKGNESTGEKCLSEYWLRFAWYAAFDQHELPKLNKITDCSTERSRFLWKLRVLWPLEKAITLWNSLYFMRYGRRPTSANQRVFCWTRHKKTHLLWAPACSLWRTPKSFRNKLSKDVLLFFVSQTPVPKGQCRSLRS